LQKPQEIPPVRVTFWHFISSQIGQRGLGHVTPKILANDPQYLQN